LPPPPFEILVLGKQFEQRHMEGEMNNQKEQGAKTLQNENSIKRYSFIAVHFVIVYILIIYKDFSMEKVGSIYSAVMNPKSAFSFLIPLICIILNGIVSSKAKESIVFWRFRNALPGCRVFTILAKNDDRIDLLKLKDMYGKLPINPRAQNVLWYSIYKKHSTEPRILDAQRNYLLARDLTAISFILMFSLPVCLWLASVPAAILLKYLAIAIIQFLLIGTSARHFGERFACTVLAIESHG
jgi:hypothetical protein